MGQLTIYLDPETERKMQAVVEQSGMSKSRWIANLIREKTADAWPEKVRELAGAWRDIPTGDEIRKALGQDAERESL
jgi:hypothetical protein